MRIRTNIAALNTQRRLNYNSRKVSGDLEKLASGYRVNRAGDDASGLAVSEKMRAQITGLETAQKNVQDGISAVQVADGAMMEQTAMLQRLIELGTQASNGIYTDQERQSIQSEVNQLLDQIESIATDTEFNKIKILGGNSAALSPTYSGSGGGEPYTRDISEFDESTIEDIVAGGKPAFVFRCSTCDPDVIINLDAGSTDTTLKRTTDMNTPNEIYLGIKGVKNGKELSDKICSGLAPYCSGGGQSIPGLHHFTISNDRDGVFTFQYGSGSGGIGFEDNLFDTALVIPLQIGSNTEDVMKMRFSNMRLSAVISGGTLDMTTSESAAGSLGKIKGGINYISNVRGRLGAYQNRLEHSLQNLGSMTENITAAESGIRDTDMAKQMMDYSKNNILIQVSQTMLTQANQSLQGILELLQ